MTFLRTTATIFVDFTSNTNLKQVNTETKNNFSNFKVHIKQFLRWPMVAPHVYVIESYLLGYQSVPCKSFFLFWPLHLSCFSHHHLRPPEQTHGLGQCQVPAVLSSSSYHLFVLRQCFFFFHSVEITDIMHLCHVRCFRNSNLLFISFFFLSLLCFVSFSGRFDFPATFSLSVYSSVFHVTI